MSVKRYVATCQNDCIEETPDGYYVLYSDYAALLAENERLKRELSDHMAALKIVVAAKGKLKRAVERAIVQEWCCPIDNCHDEGCTACKRDFLISDDQNQGSGPKGE